MTTSTNTTNLTTQFEQASKEFEAHWEMGREAAKSATIKINEMVSILHKQHEDWSFTKIANTIWSKHEHLEGFSKTTVYRNLDENNRKLFQNNSIPHGIQKLQNNNTEHSVQALEPNVIEDSTSKRIGIIQFKCLLPMKDQDIPIICSYNFDTGKGDAILDEKEARRRMKN